jgi:hypothetical protein
MRTYEISITGKRPLLMHQDDVEWSDSLDRYRLENIGGDPGKPGDDRSPAWRWIGSLYHDGEQLVMPLDNVMRCLMEAGASVSTGKGRLTFKSQTQSGIVPTEMGWPLLVNGKAIPFKPFQELIDEQIADFAFHKQTAIDNGFELFVKRARIGQSKHVRVRPKFEDWSMQGELTVVDELITDTILSQIFEIAGQYKGLGDWRPSSKTPGPFGQFEAAVTVKGSGRKPPQRAR